MLAPRILYVMLIHKSIDMTITHIKDKLLSLKNTFTTKLSSPIKKTSDSMIKENIDGISLLACLKEKEREMCKKELENLNNQRSGILRHLRKSDESNKGLQREKTNELLVLEEQIASLEKRQVAISKIEGDMIKDYLNLVVKLYKKTNDNN